MPFLIVLGCIILVLLLISLIRLGVYVSFGKELIVRAQAGPVKLQLVPKPEKKKPKKEKKKKPKKEKKKKEEPEEPADGKKKKKGLGLTFEDIRSAVPALFESLKKGLRKTRQRVKIDPMRLSLTFGHDDPAKVAEMYGWASTAVWTLMPQLENLLRMPDPRIHLDVDYNARSLSAEGEVGISLQIRDLFAIGGAFAGPLIKWGLQFLKAKKAREKAAAKEAALVKNEEQTKDQDKGE